MTSTQSGSFRSLRIAELTSGEQEDFQLIVQRAKECGWLDESFVMTAIVIGCEVEVIAASPHYNTKWVYLRSNEWLFKFLRDVASVGIVGRSPFGPKLF